MQNTEKSKSQGTDYLIIVSFGDRRSLALSRMKYLATGMATSCYSKDIAVIRKERPFCGHGRNGTVPRLL
jgi:hypothetical protein